MNVRTPTRGDLARAYVESMAQYDLCARNVDAANAELANAVARRKRLAIALLDGEPGLWVVGKNLVRVAIDVETKKNGIHVEEVELLATAGPTVSNSDLPPVPPLG